MLCTNKGYNDSVIFSLLAKSRARSKGILFSSQHQEHIKSLRSFLPDTLEMHWTDLDHMSSFLTFQYSVSSTSSHSGHVEELGAIYHVVVCPSHQFSVLELVCI